MGGMENHRLAGTVLPLGSPFREGIDVQILTPSRQQTRCTDNLYQMNDEQKNALQASLYDICKDLDAEDVLPYLCSKGVVQDRQAQEIMTISLKSTQIFHLITILKSAGPSAFQEFINALDFCEKDYLADKIQTHLSSFLSQQLTLTESTTNTNNSPQTTSGAVISALNSNSDAQVRNIYGRNININIAHGNMNSSGANGEHEISSITPSLSSQLNTDEWQRKLETVQMSFKNMYLENFKKTNPFSLPFTFDIERTWVSLALREDGYLTQLTEDHAELLKNAFAKEKMLIIEGKPATGKTSLMRRLAYEWANGNNKLSSFDLIAYAEFREVREQTFESIAELVLEYTKKFIENEDLRALFSDRSYCKQRKFLLLLDGYDESSLDKQCKELTTYLAASGIKKPLMFDIVITTRPGHLAEHREKKGRYIFADVFGFITDQQKEKYIFNHFLSTEIDKVKNIAAVINILNKNNNLYKLAETPLFLAFICLTHEKILDGTTSELYSNFIWWLINRHQQDYPDRDIPALFGFQNGSDDKFEIIQDHYLHFPQLYCLGNMALRYIEKELFDYSNCKQFYLQPVIEQVGLLRKEKKYDNTHRLVTSFFFPHRTIQEFLAAFSCFCSKDVPSEWYLCHPKLETSKMTEYERFLLRIALSDKMSIPREKRKYYFERIIDIKLDITFDGFNTIAGFKNELLNWFLSQCTNVTTITLRGELNSARQKFKVVNDISTHNESAAPSEICNRIVFSFCDLTQLYSLSFDEFTFEANFELFITNCPSLKNLNFSLCEMKNSTNLGIASLPAINTVEFNKCKIDLVTWQSITNAVRNSSIKCLKLEFGDDYNGQFLIHLKKCNNVEKMEIAIGYYEIRQNVVLLFSDLMKLSSLTFGECTFQANSQLSITNCPCLKYLKFNQCDIESNTKLGIATLPAIDTVEFITCKIDLATWQSNTNQIINSSVKCLQLSADYFVDRKYPGYLYHLQACKRIEAIHIKDIYNNILNRYEEEVAQKLERMVRSLPRLKSITFHSSGRRLKECNTDLLQKLGQHRNPDFLIKYVEQSLS